MLSVGEIYDKAIDLCLRNSGNVALALGPISLASNILIVLGTRASENVNLASMHLRLHGSISNNGWLIVLGDLLVYGVFPVVGAALCAQFDRALCGGSIGLTECFRSPIRRTANVIIAAVVCNAALLGVAGGIVMLLRVAVGGIKQSTLLVALIVVGLGLLVWVTATLTIAAATAFARVALDDGRVLQSLGVGIANVFAKLGHRRALSIGIPLVFLYSLGIAGGTFAGGVAFGLTGLDAADVTVKTIGDVAAWSLLAAVATVYYRNLTPAV